MAVAGDLPVLIPYYGGAPSKIEKHLGHDPIQLQANGECFLHPDWGASLGRTDFSNVCQIGEVLVQRVFRNVEAGLEVITFPQPIKVTQDLLVVPSEYVESFGQSSRSELSETERESLLKMVALCALAAAGESSVCYHSNGEPNFSQIAIQIEKRVQTGCPEKIRSRVLWDSMGPENRRKKITEGFGLLLKTQSGLSV